MLRDLTEIDYPLEGIEPAPPDSAFRRAVFNRLWKALGRWGQPVDARSTNPCRRPHPDDRTPYVAQFVPPPGSEPIRVEDFPGLLYAEPAVPDGTVPGSVEQLRTVWRDRDAFLAKLPGFRRVTNLPDPEWTGFHRGTAVAKQKLLMRAKVRLGVIATGFVGLLGYLMTIHNSWGTLAGVPEVEIEHPSLPIHTLVDDWFTHPVNIRNVRKAPGECAIEFCSAYPANDRRELALDPTLFEFKKVTPGFASGVKRGEDAKVSITGRIKEAGTYLLNLRATAWGGILYPKTLEVDRPFVTIVVWKPVSIPVGNPDPDSTDDHVCVANFVLALGGGQEGPRVTMRLEGEPGVVFEQLNHAGATSVEIPPPATTRNKEAVSISWRFPKLPGWRYHPFALVLKSESRRLTLEDWRKVVAKIRPTDTRYH